MAARQIRVSGRVQGVGYRISLQHEATKHGLRGWVRNRRDGSVEALLHGPPHAVDAVVAWARSGPPGARVTELVETASDEAAPGGFEVRATV